MLNWKLRLLSGLGGSDLRTHRIGVGAPDNYAHGAQIEEIIEAGVYLEIAGFVTGATLHAGHW